jgi:hypothetical protein
MGDLPISKASLTSSFRWIATQCIAINDRRKPEIMAKAFDDHSLEHEYHGVFLNWFCANLGWCME